MNAPVSDNQVLNAIFATAPEIVKPLDSEFQSFGEALFSWTNSTGFENPNEKVADGTMVRAFCRALCIPYSLIKSERLLSGSQYFESDAWLFKYIEDKGYHRMGNGMFFLLDEHYRPISGIDLGKNSSTNIELTFFGAEHFVLEFRELMAANIKVDESVQKKATYAEVVLGRDMMGSQSLTCTNGTIDNPRIALPEYYPYLRGGVVALLKDFVESDESVLILMGPPGTGKSSSIAAAVDSLNLLPIYAKRADAIMHKDFINFVFKASDQYMAKIAGTAAKARSDLFVETLSDDKEFKPTRRLYANKEEEDETPRVPVIIVEDADLLLAPRSQGNILMAELLNETDGIGSNHTRKIVFTTNLSNLKDIDEALVRAGRCYDVVHCRLLTPEEAIAARAANGLPAFDTPPEKDISLAEALRKPRKRICVSNGKANLGFGG